jgi:hypothetical protein
LAIAFGIRACLAGHRVRFATATEWVARLADAKRERRLEDELAALGRVPLLIVDRRKWSTFRPALTLRRVAGSRTQRPAGAVRQQRVARELKACQRSAGSVS